MKSVATQFSTRHLLNTRIIYTRRPSRYNMVMYGPSTYPVRSVMLGDSENNDSVNFYLRFSFGFRCEYN